MVVYGNDDNNNNILSVLGKILVSTFFGKKGAREVKRVFISLIFFVQYVCPFVCNSFFPMHTKNLGRDSLQFNWLKNKLKNVYRYSLVSGNGISSGIIFCRTII